MPFSDFLGNAPTVRQLRESLANGRLPHTMILAGPRGSGRYTLALMLAQAANCLNPPGGEGLPDFCGVCSHCARIAAAAGREERIAEAVAAREELREADKRETRILIQTHPDVLIVPPDPPQNLIKVGQVRTVIREASRMPAEARRSFFILTAPAFMKEAANALLKVLEEPPPHATFILIATQPGELLPTIRSRASLWTLGALSVEELESLLVRRRPELKPQQRALVARLAQGAAGRAVGLDLEGYLAARQAALTILRGAAAELDASTLFRMTETYRGGAEGQGKTEQLLGVFAGLLEDVLMLQAGAAGRIRNIDLAGELTGLADALPFSAIEGAARSLREVETGMRRNLLRSLSLDAWAFSLGECRDPRL